MKSKFTTYLLITAVVVLWGIIIKKVFFSDQEPVQTVHTENKPAQVAEAPEVLSLDYRDPFRPMPNLSTARVAAPSKPKKGPSPKQVIKENVNIRFVGRLQCDNTFNYIVEVSGCQYTVSPGEEANGFRLTRMSSDSLYFSRKGEIYAIAIQ